MVFVSAHEMVHLFKLGERTTAASTATSVIATGSIERRDRPMDGGDEAYLDERKKGRGNGVPAEVCLLTPWAFTCQIP